MTIKMNLPNGTSIEGNAEELFELGKLLNDEEEATSLSVGDYVKIKEEHKYKYGTMIGDMVIGKVETTRSEGYSEDSIRIICHKDSKIKIDTPFEINLDYFKKVKTPSDRELSFLKAGREVGELRKGDIVKLEGFFIDRFHKVYDVYKDTADVGSFYEDISQMSLVTPVDERLDLSDDDK